jgi:hypothetical protein
MHAEVVVSARTGDMRGIADDTLMQDVSPPPKVTPAQALRAALYVECHALNYADCRELLEALGLAPTTSPEEG